MLLYYMKTGKQKNIRYPWPSGAIIICPNLASGCNSKKLQNFGLLSLGQACVGLQFAHMTFHILFDIKTKYETSCFVMFSLYFFFNKRIMHRFVHIGQLGINWSELCSLFTFPVGFPLEFSYFVWNFLHYLCGICHLIVV